MSFKKREDIINIISFIKKRLPGKSAPGWHQVAILRKCMIESEITELVTIAKRTDRTKFRHQVLNPLIEDGLLEMTIPDKPISSKQKYRLTEKGLALLKKQTKQAGGDE